MLEFDFFSLKHMLRKGMRVIMEEDISKFVNVENLPEHIAIIMDGNRRWAKENNLDTASGHKEGAENLKRIAKFANKIGIKYLTVYAFSTEN